MKNKKLLLTIAMIMSLVMAVSCSNNGNQTTDPNSPNTPPATEDKTMPALSATDATSTKNKDIDVANANGSDAVSATLALSGIDGIEGLSFTISEVKSVSGGTGGKEDTIVATCAKEKWTLSTEGKLDLEAKAAQQAKADLADAANNVKLELTVTAKAKGYKDSTFKIYLNVKRSS